MACTQHALVDAVALTQAMATFGEQPTVATHQAKDRKDQAQKLDTTHLEPSIPSKDTRSEEELEATLHSHQTPTPTPTTPATKQPAPLAASNANNVQAQVPEPPSRTSAPASAPPPAP